MYKLSARQILVIALLSAVFSAGFVMLLDRFSNRLQPGGAAFVENAPAGISDPSSVPDERNNIEVYRVISPGVAFITTESVRRGGFFGNESHEGSGSGSVIDNQGHILTNDHVVAGAQKLSVSFGGGGRAYPARLIGRDPDTDLAVIKVDAPRDQLTVVPLGDSDKLSVGQKVLAIGNPFGLDRTLTTGVISGLQRPIRARNKRTIEGAIQTDASINPGNSGGPLLDSQGRMIGINSQILSPSGGSNGVGFAVPVNIAKRIVPQLISNGQVVRPTLGIKTFNVGNIRNQVQVPVEEGVIIYEAPSGGSAAASGLRGFSQTEDGDIILGDIITAIDGQSVSDNNDLFSILDKHKFGDVVQVEVVRNNRKVTLPVRLTAQQRVLFRQQ